jgi:serine/threonine protein kinase
VAELGKGAFGVAVLVTDKAGNQFCCKAVKKQGTDPHKLEEAKEEFTKMKEVHDSRLARTFHIFQDHMSLYFVNEPYFGGDMSEVTALAAEQGVNTNEDWWRLIFAQCFEGLRHMHVNCLMHCDIKEDNIMLKTKDCSQPEIVIIDFGLAQTFTSERAQICGTPGYIPPETWATFKWYPKGDCFSMGVAMLQLMSDNVPSQKTGKQGIFVSGATSLKAVGEITCMRPAPLELIPAQFLELRDILWKLLMKNREQRINAVQIIEHPWLRVANIATNGNGYASPPRQLRPTQMEQQAPLAPAQPQPQQPITKHQASTPLRYEQQHDRLRYSPRMIPASPAQKYRVAQQALSPSGGRPLVPSGGRLPVYR